jgi:hypothetical protein
VRPPGEPIAAHGRTEWRPYESPRRMENHIWISELAHRSEMEVYFIELQMDTIAVGRTLVISSSMIGEEMSSVALQQGF